MPAFPILFTCLLVLSPFPFRISSTSLPDNSLFDPNLTLVGAAKLNATSSTVQLTSTEVHQTSHARLGLLVRPKPIKLLNPTSFATDFTFSFSPSSDHQNHTLAFIIFPTNRNHPFEISPHSRFFAVEYDASVDASDNVGDKSASRIKIDAGEFVLAKEGDVLLKDLVLDNGMKVHSWVDYDSSSKRLEVRLSEFGSPRPYEPVLAYGIDLSGMWGHEEVLIGLSLASGGSSVYSWKFRTRSVPKGLHSLPMDPRAVGNKHGDEKVLKEKRVCVLGFLSGLVFVTGCGALAAFVVMYLWAMFAGNGEVASWVKISVHPADFRYEKINVVIEDSSNAAKN